MTTPVPSATLWLTPNLNGFNFVLTPPDLNGNELVGVMFEDPVAGPVALAFHPSAAQIIINGIQSVMRNLEQLRADVAANGNTAPVIQSFSTSRIWDPENYRPPFDDDEEGTIDE